MKSLYVSLIGSCLLGLATAGSVDWDRWLDDGVPPAPVQLDEVERTPLIPEPLREDCNRFALADMLKEFESNVEAKSPKAILRRKTVPFCKEILEKEAIEKLAKVDDGAKERVNFLVEGMNIPAEAKGVSGGDTLGGILKAMDHNGANLSSIKSYEEFNPKYKAIMADCNALHKELANVAYQYEVFLESDSFEPEPAAAQWIRNTLVCGFLKDRPIYGNDAYRLLEQKNGLTKEETEPTPMKKGKHFNIFKPFSRKSKS